MATYTRNYGLHQWEREDPVLHSDFNEDFAKIDAAIKEVETAADSKLAKKASQEQLAQGLSRKVEVVQGSVVAGDGGTTVNLGFRPKLLLWFMPTHGCVTVMDGEDHPVVIFTDTGFSVFNNRSLNYYINHKGEVHHYTVFK